MALTFAEIGTRQSVGNYWQRIFDITFDSSYATGGEALLPADLGFTELLDLDSEVVNGAAVRTVGWDRTNSKLLAYVPAGTEVVAATNLSAVVVRVVAVGR